MKEVSCEVIRDLLPLYEDGAASEESASLVREHLKDCPACRDELDKLRAPVSLPSEEDKEQEIRERLQQSVKELKRVRGIKLAVGFAVLAVIVLFCFWYTRPRNWADVAGPWDFTSISAQLTLHTRDGGALLREEWNLELDSGREFDLTMDKFRIALTREYRAPLSSIPRNLIFRQYAYQIANPRGSVRIQLDGPDARVNLIIFGNSNGTVYIDTTDKTTGENTGRLCYEAGEALFDVLSLLVQDYGTPVSVSD